MNRNAAVRIRGVRPECSDHPVYMVMEHLGQLGMISPEADVENSNSETVVVGLLDAQYGNLKESAAECKFSEGQAAPYAATELEEGPTTIRSAITELEVLVVL